MKQQDHDGAGRGVSVTDLLATAAAIAAGTASYADVVRFENPEGQGQFYWDFSVLDIRLPNDEQPGTLGGASTSYQDFFSDYFPQFSYTTSFQSGGGMRIFSSGFNDRYAAPLDAGTIIGPGTPDGSFIGSTVFEFDFYSCEYIYDPKCQCYYYGNCESGSRGIIPEGVETYLGTRFTLPDGDHFGWVKIERSGVTIEALAWGYETEPDVPIEAGASPACPPDLDGDGAVAFSDVLELLSNWGTDGPGADLEAPFDVVDFADLLAMLAQWGPCDPQAAGPPPARSLAELAQGSGGR